MTLLISKIQQTLQHLWMCLPYDTRQTIKRIFLFDYLYTVPRYTRIIFSLGLAFTPACAKPIQPPKHANYHKVQAFPFPKRGSDGRELFLFYDIFARNNELFVIFTEEDRRTLAIRSEDISIAIGQDQPLTLKEVIIGDSSVHVLTYAFDYPFTEHQVHVSCKGISKDFVISHACLKQTGLLLHSTLFKDDHFLLPMFYDYYTKQGVDSFVWYYNGVWDQTLQHKYSFGDNVIILDWPYPYTDMQDSVTAQRSQGLHALYKYGKPSYEYIAFFDLDEYIKPKRTNLRSYILQNPGYLCYAFLNCWAWVLRVGTTSSLRWQHLPRVLLRAKLPINRVEPFIAKNADGSVEKWHCLRRSKLVYRTRIKKFFMHSYPDTCSDNTAQERILLTKPSSIFLHFTNLRVGHSQGRFRTFSDFLRKGWD